MGKTEQYNFCLHGLVNMNIDLCRFYEYDSIYKLNYDKIAPRKYT